ncbi:MAG: kinase-like domain-containing protein [Benniella sp.]|nr:MAG: kinase-like domain-containing protein [Benniella sp.]
MRNTPPTQAVAVPPASSPVSIPVHPSSYLIKKPTPSVAATTDTATKSLIAASKVTKSAGSTKSPVGHLFLQIIEARNLTLVNPPAFSRPYCLVEYDQNELITHPALSEGEGMDRRGRNDIFARAMAASSPKWRYDAEFDVVRPNQQISITIYDSGVEDDVDPAKRFLGQVKLSPSEVHNRTIDSWFRLQGRETSEHVTGEIRVNIRYLAIESRHLSTDDFEILRVLGVGSFGKVYQVRKKDTGRIYAMKVLDKKQVIAQKQVEHTIAERNVLIQALQSPFIVGLKFSFQTPTKLYLVQDFMNGGELFFHMQNEGTFSESRARFYAAELVLALEHLHSCHVVYRDLKPENVLLSSQGHIVLVDFGLCKQNVTEDERTHTFCGTTEYLAPEIIKGMGYGKAVDWWSLGILLYEMLVGTSPFEDSRTEGVHHKILHQPVIFPTRPGTLNVRRHPFPVNKKNSSRLLDQGSSLEDGPSSSYISQNAQDLIQKLLDKNPKTRLGSGHNGAEAVAAIKAHPFFHGIDFVRLATRDVTPPFQPHIGITGDLDVSNFDPQFTDQTAIHLRKDTINEATTGGSYLSSGSGSANALVDGEAASFLLQQQQRAANLYRQRQMRGDSTTSNAPMLSRERRSSNSWSSYRTLSNDSLFSITSEPGGSVQMGSGAGGPLSRPTTAYRTRALFQQQQQTQQQRQQEYFKGFTFEGESVLESIKRQEDEQAHTLRVQLPMTSDNAQVDDEVEEEFLGRTSRSAQALSYTQTSHRSNQPFSGQPESFDSIFGSS